MHDDGGTRERARRSSGEVTVPWMTVATPSSERRREARGGVGAVHLGDQGVEHGDGVTGVDEATSEAVPMKPAPPVMSTCSGMHPRSLAKFGSHSGS